MDKRDAFFLHPQGLVDDGASVGARTRVWAFAHVAKGAAVGEDCNICDHAFIEGKVRLGNRVTVKSGVFLWDGVQAEDDVFIGPAATFVNDIRPRSKNAQAKFLPTILKCGSSIGANATVLAGLTIGRFAMIAAGAVVTNDVPDFALVVGNPARFRRWLCKCGENLTFRRSSAACGCGERYRLHNKQVHALNP